MHECLSYDRAGALYATNIGGLHPLGIEGWRFAFLSVGLLSATIGKHTPFVLVMLANTVFVPVPCLLSLLTRGSLACKLSQAFPAPLRLASREGSTVPSKKRRDN